MELNEILISLYIASWLIVLGLFPIWLIIKLIRGIF